MAADRLTTFLDPRNMYSSGLTSDFIFRGGGTLFPNLQFVPERIVQFSMTPEGIRYYKVQWQETWLPEHQLLQHQSLIEAYWRSQNELAANNSNHQMQVQNQGKLGKTPNNASTNVGFLSDLNNLSELAAAESNAVVDSALQTPITQPSSATTASTPGATPSTAATSQVQQHKIQPSVQPKNGQQQQLQQQPQQQGVSGQLKEAADGSGNDTVEPRAQQETVTETEGNIQVYVENVDGGEGAPGFVIQEIPLNVVLEQSIAAQEDGSIILTPKTQPATWKRKPNTQSLQLEGFDLVNIENTVASVEELAAQARETLSSFRRKRVRFPNGSSKLPQQCFFCLKTLSNRKKLREHQFSVHFKNVGEFMCGICKQRFVFGRQLKAHMLVHSDNRNFQCNQCGLTCKRRSHLHKHMDTHRQEKNYRCDVCHQNFKVQAALKSHCLAEHKNQLSKCNVCKQTLHTAFSVYIHSMRHSGTRDHLCETCGAGFKRKQHLIAHMNTHKETKEKIKCPECDKEVPDKKYFRKHLEQFHKELAANYRYEYVCSICDKDFAYKGRLDEHMKAHENETEQERFSRSRKKRVDSLSEEALSQISDQGIKCVDPKTNEVKLRCKLCRKREFRMISSFEKHIQDHNSGRIKSEDASMESFECDVCDKAFNSEKRLARHKLTHSSKPTSVFTCGKCNKSFRWKSCLHAHVKKCSVNKGAEKRKARLKAKEKLMRQIRNMSEDEDDDEDQEQINDIETPMDENQADEIEEENVKEDENDKDVDEEGAIQDAITAQNDGEQQHNEGEPLFAVQRNDELQFSEHSTIDNNPSKDGTTEEDGGEENNQVTQILLVTLKDSEVPAEIENNATPSFDPALANSTGAAAQIVGNTVETEGTILDNSDEIAVGEKIQLAGENTTEETAVNQVTSTDILVPEVGVSDTNTITGGDAAEQEQQHQQEKGNEMVNIAISVESVENDGVVSLSEEDLATVQITLNNAKDDDGENQNQV